MFRLGAFERVNESRKNAGVGCRSEPETLVLEVCELKVALPYPPIVSNKPAASTCGWVICRGINLAESVSEKSVCVPS